MVEERVVSFAIVHPGLGPRRVASELGRQKWGGIVVSPNGVWKVLCRHGLNTRAERLGPIAGYAAPYEPPRDPGPEQHIDVQRPGELVGIDCFSVGRLKGTEGAIWGVCKPKSFGHRALSNARTRLNPQQTVAVHGTLNPRRT
jgi:hypothetical protein